MEKNLKRIPWKIAKVGDYYRYGSNEGIITIIKPCRDGFKANRLLPTKWDGVSFWMEDKAVLIFRKVAEVKDIKENFKNKKKKTLTIEIKRK